MAHSLITILVHCVFSTKRRRNSIPDKDALFAYMGGIARNLDVELVIAGGMPNHVHLLFWLPATKSVAEVVRDFKANSSRWVHTRAPKFEWQQGYGAFSVSPNKIGEVKSLSPTRKSTTANSPSRKSSSCY